MKLEKKDSSKYNTEDLLSIMRHLRSEEGCPWDREQTSKSIKHNLIEEASEAFEAIEEESNEMLCEELGDLLLQIVFHSVIAEETDSFKYDDVVDGISRKLISRHTHVFGEDKDIAESADDVLQIWDKNKQREKKQDTVTSAMNSVSKALPSLMQAYKIQKKAAHAGFDWIEIEDVVKKIYEEISECENERAHEAREKLEDEIGDLLFAVVNYARFVNVEPESALRKANKKFIKRFAIVEEEVLKAGDKNMNEYSLEELDKFWEKAKRGEK